MSGENIVQENKPSAFSELFDRSLNSKADGIPTIEYNLPYPKEDFLNFIVQNKHILLHGSPIKDMEDIEPRQASDGAKESGNKNAIYAVTDPVLAIFHAIQDKNKLQGIIRSGLEHNQETGEIKYNFQIPKNRLETYPWTGGVIYIFSRDQFLPEMDNGQLSGEWTSEIPVKPVAKLEVGPEDFRFLNEVVGTEN